MMHVKIDSLDIANLVDNKNVGILCVETDKNYSHSIVIVTFILSFLYNEW